MSCGVAVQVCLRLLIRSAGLSSKGKKWHKQIFACSLASGTLVWDRVVRIHSRTLIHVQCAWCLEHLMLPTLTKGFCLWLLASSCWSLLAVFHSALSYSLKPSFSNRLLSLSLFFILLTNCLPLIIQLTWTNALTLILRYSKLTRIKAAQN